jgi:acyl-CoA synthetase (AMP-forming)/AMP-acid ligase II
MSPSSTFDPCEELLPTIVDHYAAVHPDKVYAEYPLSPTSYADGYRIITYRDLANAVNGIARWLNAQLGPGAGEKLTYFGPNDVRYPALAIGALKAGYCVWVTTSRPICILIEALDVLYLASEQHCRPREPPETIKLQDSDLAEPAAGAHHGYR